MGERARLDRPFGLISLVVAAALLAQHDVALLAPAPVIAFVGKDAETQDASYGGFVAALRRAWPGELPAPNLRYHQGGELSDAHFRPTLMAAAAQRPSVLVLPTGDNAVAARSLGIASPVVFASHPDPVATGIVASLRTPGRQVTGVWFGDTLDLKRLELLKLGFPQTRTVAALVDRSWLLTRDASAIAADAQRLLGLHLLMRVADNPEELDVLMNGADAAACDAWYIPPTYIAYLADAKIIAHLRRLRLPAIHASEGEVAEGALMAYSPDTRFAYDAMAELARRVALGEDAGSIPVQRPYRYTLSVRIEPDAPWARIAPSVVSRADRVHRP